MSVRRAILIEPFQSFRDVYRYGRPVDRAEWCAREYVQHDDESRTTRVLFTAPTRREVADWLEARRTAEEGTGPLDPPEYDGHFPLEAT